MGQGNKNHMNRGLHEKKETERQDVPQCRAHISHVNQNFPAIHIQMRVKGRDFERESKPTFYSLR